MQNSSENHSTVEIVAKLGKKRLTVQMSIAVMFAFLISYVVFYSDRHNDARYLSLDIYARDRAADEKIHAAESADIQRQLNWHGRTLDEIHGDVKQLLLQKP